MKILYVTPYVPSRIRTRPYNLVRALVGQGHQITLLTAAGTSPTEREQIRQLEEWGIPVEDFPVLPARSIRNCLLTLPTREPLQVVYSYHPRMAHRLRALSQSHTFDVVHIEHLRASRLVGATGDVPVVYDSVDCISSLFEQAARNGARWRTRLMATVDLNRTRRYEAQLLTRYRQVVITSRRDKQALEKLADRYLPAEANRAPITVITNGVDLEYFKPPETSSDRDNCTIVFTGKMSYHANVVAALYFAHNVLPHIWASDPDTRFQIVGKDPPEVVRELSNDKRIQVTGTVDDLRPYLAQATVAVCPALYAVGIQNKVLEAMAMGTPVVSTPAGCAALTSEDGHNILVGEGEEELARTILHVLSNPALARELGGAGRQYVEEHHSWRASARRLVQIYERASA